jgi:hypothetical protein
MKHEIRAVDDRATGLAVVFCICGAWVRAFTLLDQSGLGRRACEQAAEEHLKELLTSGRPVAGVEDVGQRNATGPPGPDNPIADRREARDVPWSARSVPYSGAREIRLTRFTEDGDAAVLGSKGSALIAIERARQCTAEGFTMRADEARRSGQLSAAALAYLRVAVLQFNGEVKGLPNIAMEWPLAKGMWKPTADALRNLVKAGALIAAEIDKELFRRSLAEPGR